MSENVSSTSKNAWYAFDGYENDVVLSTKVQLARNLANFQFPAKLRGSDGVRIQSIVFDAFNQLEGGEHFQAIAINQLDSLGKKILQERGILDSFSCSEEKDAGIILRTDGNVACTVNIDDHVHILSFLTGFDCEQALKVSQEIDCGLQKNIQFAASYDFGYLTSTVLNSGSGIHICVRVHLPSLSMLGKIRSVADEFAEKGIEFSSSFGSGSMDCIDGTGGNGASLGKYYELSTKNCGIGSEFDQLASIVSAGKKIIEMERTAREKCKVFMPSEIRNCLFRSIALARSSIFISLREAIDIISGIKWGLSLGIVSGITDSELHSLLYRIQEGNLEYVLNNGAFKFDEYINNNKLKKGERLRSLLLQEAFEDIRLTL